MAHLPYDTELARTAGTARMVPPSPRIPAGGSHVKLLGHAETTDHRPVGLSAADARHHVHVLGVNGTGKSTLLANMALSDIDSGRGVVVIDPKGDLITDIAARIPANAADRLVILDPDDPAPPPRLNALDGPDPHLATDHTVGIFARLFSQHWGPRTDDVLRAACLTVQIRPDIAHLGSIPRLLTDQLFRQRLINTVDDPVLRSFWTTYQALSEAGQAAIAAPLLNKLRAVLLRPFTRTILASGSSTLDIGQVLDGGILLARIPKGIATCVAMPVFLWRLSL